jgi:26S proteasome regulatory subunit T2
VGTKRYDAHSGGEREIQRTMLELLNQLDGFDAMTDVKVGGGLAVGGLACR